MFKFPVDFALDPGDLCESILSLMQIRKVHRQDQALWLKLRSELWPDSQATHAQDIAAFFRGENATVQAVYVLEQASGDLGGFIELNLRPYAAEAQGAQVPYIEGWYVIPALRGRGVGKALVQAAEDWARALGFYELASDTELENQGSIAAHVALGFKETERLVCFLKPLD